MLMASNHLVSWIKNVRKWENEAAYCQIEFCLNSLCLIGYSANPEATSAKTWPFTDTMIDKI